MYSNIGVSFHIDSPFKEVFRSQNLKLKGLFSKLQARAQIGFRTM